MGIQNGFMSPNDVRSLENLDLIPEELGDNNYMVNGNMIKLTAVPSIRETETKEENTNERKASR